MRGHCTRQTAKRKGGRRDREAQGSSCRVDGAKVIGTITKEDYEQVFVPLLEQARRDGHRIRFLISSAPNFRALPQVQRGKMPRSACTRCGFSTAALWSRTLLGSTKLRGSSRFFMPCPVQVFGNKDLDDAITWLQSLPEGAAVSHRLLPESGVIVVEVKQPLRAQDFEALALTADAWIEAHGELQGLVIHAREFPGWENLGSFFRHVRFVRDHQRRVKKIALAVDSKLASSVPMIGERFVLARSKASHIANSTAPSRGRPVSSLKPPLPRDPPRTNENSSMQRRTIQRRFR